MTDITIAAQSIAATFEKLPVPHGIVQATEPYRIAARLDRTFGEVEMLRDLVEVDGNGKLVCLQGAKSPKRLWQMGEQARFSLTILPACDEVSAIREMLRADLDTEPPIEHRVELVCTMLDAQGITGSDSYIQMLAWKLGDCPQRATEPHRRDTPWFSMAAITKVIDDIVSNNKPEYGRPIPIPDVLDAAGRRASELIQLDFELVNLNNTIVRLKRIVVATKHILKPLPRMVDDGDDNDWDY